uniref:Uncharacterized protein n=1 Tax=Lepeophtheirus salmonis TaxID=72036 RepID=A0A0K2U8G8_LEPSM
MFFFYITVICGLFINDLL